MYNIHQISEDDKKTVYQVLHIVRGKRNKDNISFDTYEVQNVLESVHRILGVMHKIQGIRAADDMEWIKRIVNCLGDELKNKRITEEELGYLLKIYNISKT